MQKLTPKGEELSFGMAVENLKLKRIGILQKLKFTSSTKRNEVSACTEIFLTY
jgi:hypothetical protein